MKGAGEIRAFKPKGVRIHVIRGRRFEADRFDCIIKSKGRTGAAGRATLQGLPDHIRQRVLADWHKGHATHVRVLAAAAAKPSDGQNRHRPKARGRRRGKHSKVWIAARQARIAVPA